MGEIETRSDEEAESGISLEALPDMRAAMAAQGRSLPAPRMQVDDHVVGDVPLRLYRPIAADGADRSRPSLLVFLHGGGWVLGDLDTHDACCRWLAATSGCAVLAVSYRLAPEHPFPAALDDAGCAFRWARANAHRLGCDPSRVAIGGESAGANIAAALTLMLREEGETQPYLQLLVHPPTDLRLEQPSIDEVVLPGLSRQMLELCVRCYAGDASLDDERVSPLRAIDLTGLAPAIVVTVEHDPLRDDGERYALALARAGNDVAVQRLPDLPHGFMFLPTTTPGVDAAYRLLGARLARYLRSS